MELPIQLLCEDGIIEGIVTHNSNWQQYDMHTLQCWGLLHIYHPLRRQSFGLGGFQVAFYPHHRVGSR